MKKSIFIKQTILPLVVLFAAMLSGCTDKEEQISGMAEVNILATTGTGTGNTRSAKIVSKESLNLGNGLWTDMVITEETDVMTRAQQSFPENVVILAKVFEGTSLITTIHYKTVSGGKVIIESGVNASPGIGVVERDGNKVLLLMKNRNYRFVAYTNKTSITPDGMNSYSDPTSEDVMNFSENLNINADDITLPIVFKRVLAGIKIRIISKQKSEFRDGGPAKIILKENMYPTSTIWNWQDGTYEATAFNITNKECNVSWVHTPYMEGDIETDSYTTTTPITMLSGALNDPLNIGFSIRFGDPTYDVTAQIKGIPRMQGNKIYKINLFFRAEGMDIIIKGENESGSEPA